MVESVHEVTLPGGGVRLRAWGSTHLGTVRKVNEDSLLLSAPVFAVADGMGGHAMGDRASQAAVAALGEALGGGEPIAPAQVLAAIDEANAAVCQIAAGGDGAMSGSTSSADPVTEARRLVRREEQDWCPRQNPSAG